MYRMVLIIVIASLSLYSANAQPPKNAQVVYHQGIAFQKKEQYPDAMASFFKALALYRNYDSAYVQMAEINKKFNSFDTAIRFYQKALAINPKYLQAVSGIAAIYKNVKQDVNTALVYYLKAITIDSSNKENLMFVAWCYNSVKEYDKAITYAVKALDIDNNYTLAYGELAHAVHLSGKFAEGIGHFKKNIAVSPNELPLFYCGLCYIELKDKAGALSMYDGLVKISSKMAEGLKKRIDAMN